MATFKVMAKTNIFPLEITTLSNGTSTVKTIDSNVGKDFSSTVELSSGTTESLIYQEGISLSSTNTLDNLVTALNSSTNVRWVYIKMSSDGEIKMTWSSGGNIGLWEKDDWAAFTLGDKLGEVIVNASQITLEPKSGTPTFDIVVMTNRI